MCRQFIRDSLFKQTCWWVVARPPSRCLVSLGIRLTMNTKITGSVRAVIVHPKIRTNGNESLSVPVSRSTHFLNFWIYPNIISHHVVMQCILPSLTINTRHLARAWCMRVRLLEILLISFKQMTELCQADSSNAMASLK